MMCELVYDRISVGDRARELRTALHLTQEKVAEMMNKSLRTVTDIERGVIGMSIDTLMALCKALKASPDMLLIGSEQTDDDELQWLINALHNASPEVRTCAIDIVRAYLRHH